MQICFLGCLEDLMLKNTGAPIRTYYLAKSLAALGHEVHIVIPAEKETFEWAHGVTLHGITGILPRRVLRFLSIIVGVSKASSLFLYDLSFIIRSRHIILRSNIVQAEGAVSSALITLFAKKVFKRPVVVDSHDAFQALRIKYQSSLRKILEIFLEKTTYKCADLILAVSEKDKEFLVKQGICRDKIVVIPNGVDTEAFEPSLKADKAQTIYNLNGPFQVVFVGNMEYLPNQEAANIITSRIAPKVLRHINNTKFLMIGRASLKPIVNSINVIFTGVVDNVAEFLSASDVAIAPLLQGSGTRLKILEYFSCGLPVVSTSTGAEGLDIKNEVNILIEDDMDKFAMKIVDLLKSKELRERIGKAARDLVMKKYDWRIIGKQLDAVYVGLGNN